MVFAVFRCRNWNNAYFVGVYLFSLPVTHGAGYGNHGAVVSISTAAFEDTKFPLPQHIEHENMEQYPGSDNRGEINLNWDINQPDPGKLRQFITVSSQC